MTYNYYFILSFFNTKRPTSIAQLVHVFRGKRTPSMFYLTEVNKWHHSFAKYMSISEKEVKDILQELIKRSFIIPMDKGFIITGKGLEARQAFFENQYFPNYIRTFANTNIRNAFWERFQLFAQTFSEVSYKNNQYAPIIKHPHHQENVRNLFYQFKDNKGKILIHWTDEIYFLFNKLEESRADILASQLTGYENIGLTKTQVQERLSMAPLEYDYYHQDSLEILLLEIRHNKEELPLMYAIMMQLHKETNYGLSSSTNETYQLLKQGYSIADISKMRFIKENTVREHILELAFVLEEFSIREFIPDEIYRYLHKSFKEKEGLTYKQVVTNNPEIEFMHFRLVDLERRRHNEV